MPHVSKRIEVISHELAAAYRAMPVAEKLAFSFTAHEVLVDLIKVELIRLHPDWSKERVQAETAWRMMMYKEFTPPRPSVEHRTRGTQEDGEA